MIIIKKIKKLTKIPNKKGKNYEKIKRFSKIHNKKLKENKYKKY